MESENSPAEAGDCYRLKPTEENAPKGGGFKPRCSSIETRGRDSTIL